MVSVCSAFAASAACVNREDAVFSPASSNVPPAHAAPILPIGCHPFRVGEANAPDVHDLGSMDVLCPSCNAKHWMAERLKKSSDHAPRFGLCCLQGKVLLPPLEPLPVQLERLYQTEDLQGKHFRKEIRQFNTAFAMTSMGETAGGKLHVDYAINDG